MEGASLTLFSGAASNCAQAIRQGDVIDFAHRFLTFGISLKQHGIREFRT